MTPKRTRITRQVSFASQATVVLVGCSPCTTHTTNSLSNDLTLPIHFCTHCTAFGTSPLRHSVLQKRGNYCGLLRIACCFSIASCPGTSSSVDLDKPPNHLMLSAVSFLVYVNSVVALPASPILTTAPSP